MNRISSQYNNTNTQYFLRQQEVRQAQKNAQIGSQSRLGALRDDPIAAGHLVRYQSFLSRVNVFEKNEFTPRDFIAVSKRNKYFEACELTGHDLDTIKDRLREFVKTKFDSYKKIKLSDLRESGAIEQDADVVLFLHQSEKTTKVCKEKNLPEPLNVLVGKGRNTGTGFAQLAYKKETQNIFDMDETTRGLISLAVTEPKKNEIVEL